MSTQTNAETVEQLKQERVQAANDPVAIAHYAKLVRDQSFSINLYAVAQGTALSAVPLASLRKYVDDFVMDSVGDVGRHDPVLRLLVEQVLLAHQVIGRLHCDALESSNIEARRVNTQLATSLTGELRRLTTEIQEHARRSRESRLSVTAAGEKGIAGEKGRGTKKKVLSKREAA